MPGNVPYLITLLGVVCLLLGPWGWLVVLLWAAGYLPVALFGLSRTAQARQRIRDRY
jgi:hypothetical protein